MIVTAPFKPSISYSNSGDKKMLNSLLPLTTLDNLVTQWLTEDTPSFDYGGSCINQTTSTAKLYQKQSGVVAGKPFFDHIFHKLGCQVNWNVEERQWIECNDRVVVATVTGPTNQILIGERPALNMIARASGIATRCHRLKKLAAKNKWNGIIAGTRKTTPGFRLVEKYAMLVGGVDTHRMDLSSMIMLKDNHIKASGSIKAAVKRAKSVGGFSMKIEVECQSLVDAKEAIEAGADIIMLDNFKGKQFVDACQQLKKEFTGNYLIEGSGGLTEDNCEEYFSEFVDVLSFGSITQSVPHIDYSLKL